MASFLLDTSEECHLFGEFGWLIQAILGTISFCSLIIKRYIEKNRRSWKIWFMDTSKQASSTCLLHSLNLTAAYFIGNAEEESNQCTWYFLNFTIDTLIGMGICYLLLHSLEHILSYCSCLSFKSGDYGAPPRWGWWAYQLWLWLIIAMTMKTLLVALMVIFHKLLGSAGEFILSPVEKYPNLELVMVMIIIPVVLNSLMFWITDGFLKNNKKTESLAKVVAFELLEDGIKFGGKAEDNN
ncbi:unnamed protein product [Blepharisma stoltei]|uniref:Uncharacterized protein n=1 Tax=Blepharisma stoltei TaxID=1481888 RepID=A0AAU9JCI4_9CILI|nr:unnamed protein product [Blepharisma stoltei]